MPSPPPLPRRPGVGVINVHSSRSRHVAKKATGSLLVWPASTAASPSSSSMGQASTSAFVFLFTLCTSNSAKVRRAGGGGKQGHVSILLGNNKCTKRGYWGGGAYSSWWVGQASCLPYRRPQESTL